MADGGFFWRGVRNAVACTLAVLVVSCGGGGEDDAASASASRNATGGRAFNASPGGSILVVTSNASPIGEYYAEILRNEGLNQFSLADASSLSVSSLAGYDVVLLDKTTLSPAQVNTLAHWVSAGGNLIAMAPDTQLAPLLGITPTGASMAEGYLQIDTSQAPGAGLVGQTIQYHGSAERYRLNGASSVATLYSGPNRATDHPAVTTRTVGSGSASAFAYDLATSVVYTRQGNPAWAGQERDGVAPVTSSDSFFGGGTAPDWVDRGKVAIAQADEQQRLLANMILNVGRARKPLPRFWYLPEGKKAVVVTTGDEQGDNAAAAARLDTSWSFTSPVWSAAPGLFTGSAMPMRLSAADGKLLDVYQAPAQVDGVGQSLDALLDLALGAEGYYGAFAVRTATGAAASRPSTNAAATERARDVPVLTTRQLLTWLDARNASSFASLAWNGSALGFELRAAADAVGLQAMLPWRFGTRTLQSLMRDGGAHVFTVKTIKGVDYAVFAGAGGAYVAQYGDAGAPTSANLATGAAFANGERARALAVHSAWGSSAVPTNPSINEALPVELGVKFRTSVNGVVTGVRFYKGSLNTGTHTGSLWTAGGQLLATATFTNETATGWQQVSFSTPVAITANTVYVASYFAPNGGYAYDSAYFANSGVINGALELLQNGVSGGNGVYAYGASSGFPANSFNATNYWVDVVFDDAGSPPDTTPPTVTSTVPANGATDVATTATIRVTFNEAIDPATVNSSTFELRNASNALVTSTVSYNAGMLTATLTPSSALATSSSYTASVRGGSTDPRIKDLAGNALASTVSWSFTTGSSGSSISAFPVTATPGTPSFPEALPVELGVKFRTDVAGFITGIRFYKGAANTGTHIGSLWTSGGTRLAQATFTNESATGWQQVTFGAPVAIAANTVYIASYFAPNGGFAADTGYFASAGVDNGVLHLLQNGVSGGNGVFAYGATSSFPAQTFNSSNYWVDVVFTTAAGPDTTPPAVSSTTPANGATGVAINTTIRAVFNEPLNPATVSGATFELRNASNALVAATVAWDTGTQSATLQPTSALALNSTYTATLRGGSTDPRIKDVAGNALAANHSWSFTTGGASPCTTPANPIVAENCLTGNPKSEWDVSGIGDPTIQGYATQISVNRGSTVTFKVSTTATSYRFDIYRLGYYGGLGARKITTVLPSATLPQTQPACLSDPSTGLIDCGNWAVSGSWAVPGTAVSGIYIARLVNNSTGGNSLIPFVVRDDASTADVLYKTSDSTWQAYNDYGGNSLYVGQPAGRAYKVSYNRPFNNRSSGFGRAFLFGPEYPMVRWLEANGYNMTYMSGADVERTPALVRNHRVLLSSGHDEYWTAGQRASVEAARDAGVHLAYFSGNQMFWKTRWENSIDGSATPYRTLVSYKETHTFPVAKIDPTPAWTGTWRDPRLSPPADGGRPENEVSGLIFKGNCCSASADSIRVRAEFGNLRFWRNTSVATLAPGQVATMAVGTLGYEWDEDADNGFRPPGLIRLSSDTVSNWPLLLDYGSMFGPGTATHSIVMHKRPNGALVFAAGTIRWSWGLDTTHDDDSATPGWSTTPDLRMQQATVNVLADMTAQPGSLQPGLVATSASTDSTVPSSVITAPTAGANLALNAAFSITGTAADTGGGVVAGVEVSVDGATWHPANGRNTWSYSWTPTTSGSATIRARAIDDSGNIQSTPTSVTVTVGSGGDTTPPTITARTPASGATGVAATSDVTVTFNEAMDPASISTSSFELRDSANALVAASLSYDAATRVATLNPTPTLAGLATYTVRVRGGATDPRVKDAAGNALAADSTWSFTTASADTTPPTITARTPASDATGVVQTTNVTVTFNEAMDAATINTGTFELRDSANALVAASVSYDAATRVATLDPTPTLTALATYSVRVRGGATDPRVKDAAGNTLAADSTWSFTTGGGDTTPPTITARTPAIGATGVAQSSNVTATFSEAMDASTINTSTFELRDSANALIAAAVSYDSATGVATLNPTPTLAAQATYSVRVRGGATDPRVKDAAGNALAADSTWSFTTGGDATPPTITARAPASGATAVSRTTNITVTFSEAMNAATITTSSFELRDPSNALVAAAVTYSTATNTATLNPTPTLAALTVYTVTVRGGSTGVQDVAGNALAANSVWSFTTVTDTTAPTVSSITPSSGATFVSRSANVTATFNEDMDAATINSSTFELRGPGGTLVPAVITYSATNRRATLNPSTTLAGTTTYTATVRGGSTDPRVKDGAGNALAANRVWSFTTRP